MLHRSAPPILAALTLLLLAGPAAPAPHTHVTPDGLETAACTCRPATAGERGDPARSPDGWVQDGEPRASYTRDGVPLPLVPDWVGTRTRAAGGLAWGDIDGDGDQDLVVGTYWANQFPPLADYYNFAYLNAGGMLENDPSWISSDEMHTTEVRVGVPERRRVSGLLLRQRRTIPAAEPGLLRPGRAPAGDGRLVLE